MKNVAAQLICAFVLGTTFPTGAFAETAQPTTNPGPKVEFPAPSPAANLKQRVGLTDIEIAYFRPGVKGRQVFGGAGSLVPYGEVWRTGANNATRITFSTPVKFGGADVPAGTYTLFSIPGESEWTVILNKVVDQWGAFRYEAANDLVRVRTTPVKLAEAVETFTIDINDIRDESATLNLIWSNVRVPVKLEVEFAKALTAQLEAALAPGQTPPANLRQRASAYFIDHDIDLQKALQWVNEDIAKQPNQFYPYYQKARVLAKLGDKAGALEAARKSMDLAATQKEAVKAEYTRLNQQLIDSLK